MNKIEEIIKNSGKEQLYTYYLSLGYDHRTAAALTLFTYGRFRFRDFSMDDLYECLCRGEEYLPPEVLEERKQREIRRAESWRAESCRAESWRTESREAESRRTKCRRTESRQTTDSAGTPTSGARRTGSAPQSSAVMQSAAPAGMQRHSIFQALSSLRSPSRVMNCIADDTEELSDCAESLADSALSYGRPAAGRREDLLSLAGKAGFSTDEYERIEEKDARSSAAEPTSTFRMTTNTASAGVILNQLRNGRRIDRSMVRIEEMLNYFRYESEVPADEMFHVSCELMDLENAKKYLYINVQGKEEVKDRQNIIILLDISGSMSSNAEQTQAVIATIISKLKDGDKLSLVTYCNSDSVELEAFTINGSEDRIRALEKLLAIEIHGYTHGSSGIERAYAIGKKNYIQGGNNQVILITDGDLNFGITDKGGLEALIEQKKKDNLFLSVIGTGLYNYKDDKLETLSKHGNGVYRVVNSLTDVRKSIDTEYSSLVNIIAKDVKAQVEFNPEVVESYRLLGFENRTLAREDFTNDKVISEPFGSGGYGVALYELKIKTGSTPVDSGLKYSKLVTTGSREPGTVRIRYKEPLENVSHEVEKVIETADASYTDNLRLAFIVYVCAEKLRGSDKISGEDIALAQRLYKELGDSIREKNSADLYKLAGILEKSEAELGIGLPRRPFPW